ncbi:60S ribosome subunit biogenesis protein NIP7 like protein [Dictyocoela muelleri]|nr:60S ribosome subunit biogenesis protein NIP7 like protein [Dictyocoela muelleri]
MRELKPEEYTLVTKKIENFIGTEISKVVNDNNKLYLSGKLVFLISNDIFKKTSNISKKNLILAGTIVGRFTRSSKFKIIITFLDYLAKYAVNKVYIKNSAEMNVLYGNNVLKSHLLKIPENLKANTPVVIFNQNEVPLGFGITSRSSSSISIAERNTMAVIVQSDNGEYLRNESTMI